MKLLGFQCGKADFHHEQIQSFSRWLNCRKVNIACPGPRKGEGPWNHELSCRKMSMSLNGCQPKNRGAFPPKMDGENHGSKPYEQMDDLGGKNHDFWYQKRADFDRPPMLLLMPSSSMCTSLFPSQTSGWLGADPAPKI